MFSRNFSNVGSDFMAAGLNTGMSILAMRAIRKQATVIQKVDVLSDSW